MRHIESYFKSLDGLRLFYQGWLPDSKPVAVLLISHGLAEHGGRYGNVADHFVPLGYAVYALDYRGHGRSEGIRGYVRRFSEYVDDLEAFWGLVQAGSSGARAFLVGHSVGATIAIDFTVRRPHYLAGLVLSAPFLRPSLDVSRLELTTAKCLSAIRPRSGLKVIDASTISRDPAVVKAYVSDPLVYRGKISARLGAELFDETVRLQSVLAQLRLPILVMHGTADCLSNPESSRQLIELAGSGDKTLKWYEGFCHEVFNDPERGLVFADMEAWLAAHLA